MVSSLDRFGRHTFHTEDFTQHITGGFPKWLMLYARDADANAGVKCYFFYHRTVLDEILDNAHTIVFINVLNRFALYSFCKMVY